MHALTMVTRAARRRQVGGLVLIAVLLGLAGGAVLAAAAGARRTSSSLERFRATSRAADVELDVRTATPEQLAALRRDPAVERVGHLRQIMLAAPGAGPEGAYLPATAAVDETFGHEVDRARLLRGRFADPTAVHEMEISESFAEQAGLDVGDTFTLGTYSPAQTEAGGRGEQVGVPAGPDVRFTVVGIVRRPFDLGIAGASGGVLIATPAFHERYRDEIGGYVDALLRVRARDGDAGVPDVIRAARGIFGDELFMTVGVTDETSGVSDAIEVLTSALGTFAVVAGLALATALTIVVLRQLGAEEDDQPSLAAMGLTRPQRAVATAAVIVPSALVGGVLAVALAVAASPLLPFGVARDAEPDPGLVFDATVLGAGFVVLVGFTLAVALVAGWRVAGVASRTGHERVATRPTVAARVARGTGASPALATGVRFAFEAGRGARAVPVRTALVGTALGVLGITASLVFGASLDHLASTPRLYGWNWHATLEVSEPPSPGPSGRCTDVDATVARDPALAAVAAICFEPVEVDGRPVTGWFLEPLRGRVTPTIIDGRAPQVEDEVALGSATLDAIGKNVGDSVRARGERAHRYRIVGRVVLPNMSFEDTDPIAEGALFTGVAITELFEPVTAPNRDLVATFVDGAPAGPGPVRLRGGEATLPTPPTEVDRLDQVGHLPAILAGLLALLAVSSVAHVTLVGIRRRRHDLGILRAVGFSRRDVRVTIGAQASLVGGVGLLVGVPLGLVVGRVVWHGVADGIGAVPVVVVPWAALAGVALVALVVVNLVGLVGARVALRERPAVVLAAE